MKKRFLTEDMEKLQYVSQPMISEDGTEIAYTVTKGTLDKGIFISEIRILQNTEKGKVLWKENGSCPKFLGNHTVAFLNDESGEKQIYLCNFKTGIRKQVTTARHGVRCFSTGKMGKHLVFELELCPEELECAFTTMEADEKEQWERELDMRPYEATNLTYKMDEWHGMRKGQMQHIAVVDLDTLEQTLITGSDLEAEWPILSSDEEQIVFYGYPHKGAKGRQQEVFVSDLAGKEVEQLTDCQGVYANTFPGFIGHTNEVIYTVFPELADGSTILLPYAVNVDTKETRALITEEEDIICHGLYAFPGNRTEYGEMTSYYCVDAKEEYLYFLSCWHGRENLYRKKITEEKNANIECVIAGENVIHEFAYAGNGTVLYTMSDDKHPAELYLDGKQLSFCNKWLEEYELPETKEFETDTKDGKEKLQVWMTHPVIGEKSCEKESEGYPAVLYVRGGPECTYNLDFWHEFLALASAGVAVIYTNPRGSLGYGRAFCADAIAWKQEAMEDLLTAVDVCIEKGNVDKNRVGITGGSYGGYMTNKFIGRSDRFAAAVTQRSLVNPVTSYGTGDMGFISAEGQKNNVKMIDYLNDRARGNALTYIDHMKTPLLLLHGFEDYRCSFEQAEQLFIAMKERNPEVPVRLVMFPKGNHGMTRTGKLYSQVRHLQEMIRWFQLYLRSRKESEGAKDE